MRERTINKKTYMCRSLTRKEVKSLKEYGFYSQLYSPPIGNDFEKTEEGFDKVLEIVFSKEEIESFDHISNPEVNSLFQDIIKETYGVEEEEKNLQKSGDGAQTQNA